MSRFHVSIERVAGAAAISLITAVAMIVVLSHRIHHQGIAATSGSECAQIVETSNIAAVQAIERGNPEQAVKILKGASETLWG